MPPLARFVIVSTFGLALSTVVRNLWSVLRTLPFCTVCSLLVILDELLIRYPQTAERNVSGKSSRQLSMLFFELTLNTSRNVPNICIIYVLDIRSC